MQLLHFIFSMRRVLLVSTVVLYFVAIYFVLTVLMSSFEVNVLVFQSDEHYSEFGCSLLIAILASIDFVDS